MKLSDLLVTSDAINASMTFCFRMFDGECLKGDILAGVVLLTSVGSSLVSPKRKASH